MLNLRKRTIKNIIISISLMVLTISFFSTNVVAEITVGGEIKTILGSYFYENGDIKSNLTESLDLELFIPSFADTDAKVQFVIQNPDSGGINFKKLYLKHKFDDFYLTVGRQPVSWSFGSLLNPVDFSLGAVAMDQETMGKYQDAIEFYYPINWNSSFELIAADNHLSDDLKWAVRGRTGFKGYDLTFNYVKEPVVNNSLLSILPIFDLTGSDADKQVNSMNRLGFTAKGDLGPIGAYTSVGYYKIKELTDSSYSYLLGGDYSFTYNYDKKITLQLEYLSLQDETLINYMKTGMGIDNIGKSIDLILGNVNYPIDDFSSIGLFIVSSLDDGSTVLMPVYENQLPGNIKLSLSSSIFVSEKEKILSGQGINAGTELSLSYAF